jgi:colicin import membrane protein
VTHTVSSDQYLAGTLAVLVHLLFFLVLFFGVSWKQLPNAPVYADLWRNLPSPTEAARPAAAEPVKQPVVPPKPVPRPAPRPVPKETPPVVAKPDIALKAARKKEEEKRHLAEVMQQAEQARLAKEAKQLQDKLAQEHQAAEQKKQAEAQARKNVDAMLAAQMSQELNQESQAIRQSVQDKMTSKQVADYVSRIRQKIRGLIRLPTNLKGNPEVVYKVNLLPNGEVVEPITLLRSSGQAAYDQEVERAILKASPLPLPPDRNAASVFLNGLNLSFKPHEP